MSIHVVTEELCSVCEIVGVCVRARLTSNLQPWEKNISFDSTEKSNEFRVTWRLDSLLHYCKYPGADWLFSTQTEQHVLFHFVKKKIGKSVHPKFQYTDTFEMLGSTVWVRLKKWLKWWNQLAKLLQTSFKSVNGLIYSNCLRSKNKFESLWKLLNKKQHIALLISHWNHHRINSSCSWVKAKKRLLAVLTVWKTTTPVTVCKPTQSAVYEKKKKGYSYTFVYFNILCQPKERAHAQTVEAKHFQQVVDFIFVYMFLSSVTGEKTETLEEKSPTDALLCSWFGAIALCDCPGLRVTPGVLYNC